MRILIRHFFDDLLRPEIVAGEDSYKAWLAQVAAVFITISWLIPIELFRRYQELHGLPGPRAYQNAWTSDSLFALTLMSLIIGILTLIEWPALFPSRRDFLVLMPLPLTRAQLFLSKLAALSLFVTMFVSSLTVMSSIALPAVSSGRWEPHAVLWRMLALFLSSSGLCYFVFFALLAVQGLVLNILPMRWFPPISFGLQVFLLLLFLCALPIFPYLRANHWLVAWLPPAWFLQFGNGILNGDSQATVPALNAFAIALCGAGFTYVLSYLRYARFSSESVRRDRKRLMDWPALLARSFPATTSRATAEFILRTLARGQEQKLILLLIGGVGVALVAESSVYLSIHRHHSSTVEEAVIGIPLTISFFAMVGLRRAFRTPSELPANWLFGFVEDPQIRVHQLDAAFWTFASCGALPVLLICAPIQIATFGTHALPVLVLQALLMLTLAEHLLKDWRAIPFTFAQNPARRHVIQSAVIHLGEFWLYSVISSAWIQYGIRHPRSLMWFSGIVLACCFWAHSRRRREWGQAPLEFAEPDMLDVQPLSLTEFSSTSR